MKRGEILDAVKNTITKDRNDKHGEPENSFPRIAEVWSDYLKRLGWVEPKLKPSDVAEMLAIFKTCRFETQPDNPDNEHDRIGYYAIAAELRAKERMEGLDWVKLEPIGPEVQPASAAREVINGGPPPAQTIFPPKLPKNKGDIAVFSNKVFVARKRFGTDELFWVYDGEAPGTPNRKPNFQGEIFIGKMPSGEAAEWTGAPNANGELLWHRTK